MRQIEFSRPEKTINQETMRVVWVSYCSLGGCVIDPTRKGVELQIRNWKIEHATK